MNAETLTPVVRVAAAVLAPHAPAVVRASRLAFFAFAALLLLALWRRGSGAAPRAKSIAPRGPAIFGYVTLCLVAILFYQASWQLAGFVRPDFIAFIRSHNHRPINPAGQARGRILDRHGAVLAFDDPAAGGHRTYPFGPACAHLVGYDNPLYGQTGIEAADDRALYGRVPDTLNELPAFGERLLDHGRARGGDLRLTIDAQLQQRAIDQLAGRPGAVVGLRPADGAILILVSSPSFDPNHPDPARLDRQAHTPMFNRALQGRYAPGSTFKLITACKAAEIGFTGTIDCPGSGYTPRGARQPIRDHEYFEAQRHGSTWAGPGAIDLDDAFARSSNVFFAQLGSRLGAAALDNIALRFGFNRRIAIFHGSSGDVFAESSAFPELTSRPAGETAEVAIGQGSLAVTPLQMALVTAAIANKGIMMAPRCRADAPVERLAQATTPEAARRVLQLMRGSVLHGTSSGARLPGIEIAGKTGTAQKQDGEKDNSWFVCAAPYGKPAIVLAVLVEGGGFGAQAALPVAVDLIQLAAKRGWELGPESTNAPARKDSP